uniref:Uncharacterized protein n=1 Tax=Ceratitis capitata TaxID=7213 RepID=W8B354_CERCA
MCCSRKAINERKADIGDEAAAAAAAAAAGITCVSVCVCVCVWVCVSDGVAAAAAVGVLLTSSIADEVAAGVGCVELTPDNIVVVRLAVVAVLVVGDTVNCHGLPGDSLPELDEFDEDVELPEIGPI